jgi:hypothetical protein
MPLMVLGAIKSLDHPNPNKSLAAIELQPLMESPKSMAVSDDHWN